MSWKERNLLLRVCKRNAKRNLNEGKRKWVVRHMLVHLAFNSGLRVSEIAALKIENLQLNGKENYIHVMNGKGNRKRDIYIDYETAQKLKDYLKLKAAWGQSVIRDAPLFSGRAGGHYTTTALEISFKKAVLDSGLSSHYSIHSARHTYATILLSKTKNNIRFVQKQLGHASIAMTSLYADILPEMNQVLANSILNK